jgi:hypothetical protein
MSFCLSSGDDPDYPLCLLDKDNNDHSTVEKPDADLAILAIVASRVEPDEHRSVEDGVNIGEVHAVPADVRSILLLIPLNLHHQYSAYTA